MLLFDIQNFVISTLLLFRFVAQTGLVINFVVVKSYNIMCAIEWRLRADAKRSVMTGEIRLVQVCPI